MKASHSEVRIPTTCNGTLANPEEKEKSKVSLSKLVLDTVLKKKEGKIKQQSTWLSSDSDTRQ